MHRLVDPVICRMKSTLLPKDAQTSGQSNSVTREIADRCCFWCI